MIAKDVFFAHANGFPAQSYQTFFQYLQPHKVHYIDCLGHNPDFAVTDGWGGLVDELRATLKTLPKPLIGVGHSLGGILILLAAKAEPEAFSHIVLLEPPLLSRTRAVALAFLKKLGLQNWVTPSRHAAWRRAHFRSLEEAKRHYHKKPLFAQFDPRCFEDYVKYGLVPTTQGFELKFSPVVEATIYNTIPHRMDAGFADLQIPTLLMYGQDSIVIRPQDRSSLARRLRYPQKIVPGGHLFPFEHPNLTATWIKLWVNACFSDVS